ncbi:hypothetical protein GCM10022389_29110 [Flavobacterium cheonanense]|uniref:Transposase DDE domain-containing protein n=1 Tax=Flavobacterium cheonanense TaxID=706183 RepID=A0ABP7W546_9FLAO
MLSISKHCEKLSSGFKNDRIVKRNRQKYFVEFLNIILVVNFATKIMNFNLLKVEY